jgi:hypothetical protein
MKRYECGFGKKRVEIMLNAGYALKGIDPASIEQQCNEICDALLRTYEFRHLETDAQWSFETKKVHLFQVKLTYDTHTGKYKESLQVPPMVYFNVALEGRVALHTEGKASCPDTACGHLRPALYKHLPDYLMITEFEVI